VNSTRFEPTPKAVLL